jgi:hypothetical protein
MIADDSTFYTSSPDITVESNIESDLDWIHNWCQSNQLYTLEKRKQCNKQLVKRVHLPRQSLDVSFAGSEIECVPSHKPLGVTTVLTTI